MKSHTYAFSGRELVAATTPPLGGLALLAALLHGLAALGWLPSPLPLRSMDQAVLWHRITSSRLPAGVVLVGDSSCLMGVSARQLSELLGLPVRNLGAVSTLGLDAFATLAADAVAAAGDPPPTVVLLVHPDFLRRPAPEAGMDALFRSLRESGEVAGLDADPWQRVLHTFGAATFRDRIESRIRPTPLLGAYARRYGFTWELLAAMDADGGGAVDPGYFAPGTSVAPPPLEVSPRLETAAAAFVSRLPDGTPLRVGVMPIPQSLAGPEDATRQARALRTLCGWMGSRAVPLSTLPAVLPDEDFASPTHLNESGRAAFTRRLAETLRVAEGTRSPP